LALRKFELTAMGVWPSVAGVTRNTASTVGRGLKDLEASETLRQGCVRRLGDRRKSLGKTDSRLHHDLNAFVARDEWRPYVAAALEVQEPAPPNLGPVRISVYGLSC
jgi:hypothetical protein